MSEKLKDVVAEIVFVVVIVWCVVILALCIRAGLHTSKIRHKHQVKCHSLGADYHYWIDRQQCVKYVQIP